MIEHTRGRGMNPFPSPVPVRPTPQQLAWQQAELTMFFHFGINTFTDREWGDGTEDPKRFDPSALDVRQWVRTARETGFRYVILTAKHHDGFCLWPSRFTEHSVKNSPWRGGRGDLVREFAAACRAEDLKMGLYLSPWDRNSPVYGTPAYNDYYVDQLTELLTGYGEVAEVWLDGANGEGPNGRRQEYDYDRYYRTVRRLQPTALIAINGPDIRWVGNENGLAAETEWSIRKADPARHKGITGDVWWPAECDTSIRPGWFWHAKEDSRVKTRAQLLETYFSSVGRNSVLLLNVPPNDRGLLPEPDVRRLREFQDARREIFANDAARGARVTASSSAAERGCDPAAVLAPDSGGFWQPDRDDPRPAVTLAFSAPRTVSVFCLQERIADGQRVAAYTIEALDESGWREVVRGTTIGHKKLDRVAPVTATRFRITIRESRGAPRLHRVALYRDRAAGTPVSMVSPGNPPPRQGA
jgi:alpha-L-fucosidase